MFVILAVLSKMLSKRHPEDVPRNDGPGGFVRDTVRSRQNPRLGDEASAAVEHPAAVLHGALISLVLSLGAADTERRLPGPLSHVRRVAVPDEGTSRRVRTTAHCRRSRRSCKAAGPFQTTHTLTLPILYPYYPHPYPYPYYPYSSLTWHW